MKNIYEDRRRRKRAAGSRKQNVVSKSDTEIKMVRTCTKKSDQSDVQIETKPKSRWRDQIQTDAEKSRYNNERAHKTYRRAEYCKRGVKLVIKKINALVFADF